MINYQVTSDATDIYRDVTGARIVTTNGAGDLGNTAAIIRDSTIRVSAPIKTTQVMVTEKTKVVG